MLFCRSSAIDREQMGRAKGNTSSYALSALSLSSLLRISFFGALAFFVRDHSEDELGLSGRVSQHIAPSARARRERFVPRTVGEAPVCEDDNWWQWVNRGHC